MRGATVFTGSRERTVVEDKGDAGADTAISGGGGDRSFDGLLAIVVPSETYGSSNKVAYGTSRLLTASDSCSPFHTYNCQTHAASGCWHTNLV